MEPVLLDIESVSATAAGLDEPASIARLTINRADKANALNLPTMHAFVDAVHTARSEPSLRALVVTGAGDRAFVGGADIHAMGELDTQSAREFITAVHQCCHVLRETPVPVIGRVNGVAFGAGQELAASCDLLVAVEDAQFGMPEVRLGIPSVVEAALLPQTVGWGRTREMLLLGELFSAADALQWGLVQRVVSRDRLDAVVDEWIASLLANGPRAVRTQNALIRQWESASLPEAVAASIDAFAQSWQHDEPKAMMRAWRAARKK